MNTLTHSAYGNAPLMLLPVFNTQGCVHHVFITQGRALLTMPRRFPRPTLMSRSSAQPPGGRRTPESWNPPSPSSLRATPSWSSLRHIATPLPEHPLTRCWLECFRPNPGPIPAAHMWVHGLNGLLCLVVIIDVTHLTHAMAYVPGLINVHDHFD